MTSWAHCFTFQQEVQEVESCNGEFLAIFSGEVNIGKQFVGGFKEIEESTHKSETQSISGK